MSLNWDKLRIFHTVAEVQNLTKASIRLNISQSALSRQITSLEEQLGVPLFYRHARGMILTEPGDMLYNSIQDIHPRLDLIESQIMDSQHEAAGPLVVTGPSFMGGRWFMSHVHEFEKNFPDMRLTFIFSNEVFDLTMREADVGLRFNNPTEPTLVKRRLTSIGFKICASKEYIASHRPLKVPSDLRYHKLIGYPMREDCAHQHISWLFDLAGVSKDTHDRVMLVNSMEGIAELVRSGSGVGCLPEYMLPDYPEIEVVLANYAPPAKDLFFVYPEERRHSKRIAVFRDFMIDVVNQADDHTATLSSVA